jgi:hypothetical protein
MSLGFQNLCEAVDLAVTEIEALASSPLISPDERRGRCHRNS